MFKGKKLLVLFLVLALILGTVGCSSPVTEQPASGEEPKQEQTTQEQVQETTQDMGYAKSESLVSAKELKDMMDKGEVKVIDFRDAKLPGGYIPGSVKVSRGDIATAIDGVKGMIAPKEQIEKVLGEAGIANGDTVVIYDADKELWAARLWWVMKVYGHEDVRLLNGGLDAWEAEGFDTATSPQAAKAVTYEAKNTNTNLVADLDMVKESFDNKDYVVLDTRSEKEYNDGHVPGAVWIEWTNVLNEDGTYKSADELREIYETLGITSDKVAIMPHCKSAVRAAHTLFALTELLGYENVKNYDGSWLEYSTSDVPVAKTNEYAKPESLVSAKQLKDMLDSGKAKVVDFRDAKLPGGYIPGAVKVARGDIAAEVNGVKGMIASKEKIEKVLGEAGITNDDTVVIYDADKELWASRLWWVMKVYGHKDVRLLNGGLDAWEAAGFETEGSAAKAEAVTYTAKEADKNLIADIDMVKSSFDNDKLVVLDTRSEKEWNDGHIPQAVWIEWTKALNEDGTFKDAESLLALYASKGITADKEAIMPHCKSAVRAAHSLFVLTELLGYENVRNYDGSWLEYSKSGEKIDK